MADEIAAAPAPLSTLLLMAAVSWSARRSNGGPQEALLRIVIVVKLPTQPDSAGRSKAPSRAESSVASSLQGEDAHHEAAGRPALTNHDGARLVSKSQVLSPTFIRRRRRHDKTRRRPDASIRRGST
jgi:hypothetical protein